MKNYLKLMVAALSLPAVSVAAHAQEAPQIAGYWDCVNQRCGFDPPKVNDHILVAQTGVGVQMFNLGGVRGEGRYVGQGRFEVKWLSSNEILNATIMPDKSLVWSNGSLWKRAD